jgi:hypothetical protein
MVGLIRSVHSFFDDVVIREPDYDLHVHDQDMVDVLVKHLCLSRMMFLSLRMGPNSRLTRPVVNNLEDKDGKTKAISRSCIFFSLVEAQLIFCSHLKLHSARFSWVQSFSTRNGIKQLTSLLIILLSCVDRVIPS